MRDRIEVSLAFGGLAALIAWQVDGLWQTYLQHGIIWAAADLGVTVFIVVFTFDLVSERRSR